MTYKIVLVSLYVLVYVYHLTFTAVDCKTAKRKLPFNYDKTTDNQI